MRISDWSSDVCSSDLAKRFGAEVLGGVLPRLHRKPRPAGLDCGCGTGAWLAFLQAQLVTHGLTDARLCGFDLSPRMVEVAREKLRDRAAPADLRPGNLLERTSYSFEGLSGGFDQTGRESCRERMCQYV